MATKACCGQRGGWSEREGDVHNSDIKLGSELSVRKIGAGENDLPMRLTDGCEDWIERTGEREEGESP